MAEDNTLSLGVHAWTYGTIPAWRDFSRRVAEALKKAGIPDVQRRKMVYYDNPKTARWEVSFPEAYLRRATEISDAMQEPTTSRRWQEPRKP